VEKLIKVAFVQLIIAGYRVFLCIIVLYNVEVITCTQDNKDGFYSFQSYSVKTIKSEFKF
jgi:hypothetical protein